MAMVSNALSLHWIGQKWLWMVTVDLEICMNRFETKYEVKICNVE